jgi:hypothetical protein
MSLAEKGVLWQMRLQCWASLDGTIPSNPDHLTRLLGVSADELRQSLTTLVRGFFETVEQGRLRCPELDSYRAELIAKRSTRASAGRRGANSRWGKKGNADGNATNLPMANAEKSKTALSREELRGAEPLSKRPSQISDPVAIREMEQAFGETPKKVASPGCTPEQYRAAKGR